MKFTIEGRLPSLNEYIKACRTAPVIGNRMKHKDEELITLYIRKAKLKPIYKRVRISYTFYEPNNRRDLDNVSGYAHKVIQDALVKAGILSDDSWGYIAGYRDEFELDKKNPRIEVELEEVNDGR